MLARLSDLLRLTLDRIGTQQLQLKEELDFIEKYLEIEHTRFGDRLRVVFDIDPAAARRGGAEPGAAAARRERAAPRHRAESRWRTRRHHRPPRRRAPVLVVRDDGYGVPSDELEALNEGVGVSNTRSRLALLYGGPASLRVPDAGRVAASK